MKFQTLEALLAIPRGRLGAGTSIKVRVVGSAAELAQEMARFMAAELKRNNAAGKPTRWIVPVGPVDQYPILAELCNRERISLANAYIFNMDEYCDERGQLVLADHPLSFVGYMTRWFYELLDPELRPPVQNRIFPDPADPGAIERRIAELGGIDTCFAGIGINGHIAFNEPPEPGEEVSAETFRNLPTRVLPLSRETRTINSVTAGAELRVVPTMCVTIGMREILAARSIRIYCNRPWQSGIVRRIIHGPVTPAVPASFLQEHPDVTFTLADYVAEPPDIRLR